MDTVECKRILDPNATTKDSLTHPERVYNNLGLGCTQSYAPSTTTELNFNVVAKKVVALDSYELTAEGQLNPFNKANKPVTTNWIQNLLKKYGIYQNINNLDIYQQAFIHTSYTIPHIKEVCYRDGVTIKENPDGYMLLADKSYERMEFLGDTIIDGIIGSYVYARFPDGTEGFLSTMKKKLISRWTLGYLADICSFTEYIVISKTLDDKQSGRTDIDNLCDVMEAFIAAIYLDFNKTNDVSKPGFQIAEKFLINLIEADETYLDMTSLITDGDNNYKIKLRNYYRKTRQTDVIYTTVENGEGDWLCNITIKKNKHDILASANGKAKRDAEYNCAYVLLKKLNLVE